MRLHDAAAAGELPEPARDADAAAAGIALSAVAGTVAANYQTCHENAEQLRALQNVGHGDEGCQRAVGFSTASWIVPATRAPRIEERDLCARRPANGLEYLMAERLLISVWLPREHLRQPFASADLPIWHRARADPFRQSSSHTTKRSPRLGKTSSYTFVR